MSSLIYALNSAFREQFQFTYFGNVCTVNIAALFSVCDNFQSGHTGVLDVTATCVMYDNAAVFTPYLKSSDRPCPGADTSSDVPGHAYIDAAFSFLSRQRTATAKLVVILDPDMGTVVQFWFVHSFVSPHVLSSSYFALCQSSQPWSKIDLCHGIAVILPHKHHLVEKTNIWRCF